MPVALLLVLSAALAACGDLPRPFQPAEKSTKAWAGPGDAAWGSVLVPPIGGLPQPQSAALVDEVVEALHLRDVPASAHAAGRGSIVLSGQVAVVAGKLRWTLVTPDGKTALRFDEPLPDAAASSGAVLDRAAVAARAAAQVSAALKPPATDDRNATTGVRVALESVRGAPGDGGIALARAMRHALARIGVAVADAPDEGSLSIRGRVAVASGDIAANDATVAIAWDVFLPDGKRLGTVSQSNRVAEDRLTGTWGVLPEVVARAGAPGIAQLLGQASASPVARVPRREQPRLEARPALLSRPPLDAPLALPIEASPATPAPPAQPMQATAPTVLAETPPVPLPKPLPTPHFKPRPEAPIALAVAIEAPIAVSVTVR